jgi:hypothetical protein
MSIRRLGRRAFLSGAGGTLVGLPLLEATSPKTGAAQGPTAPKRLVILSMGHSMDVEGSRDEVHFVPEQSGGVLTAVSPILEPLTPHMDKVSFLSGLDNLVSMGLASNGHNGSGRTVLSYTPHIGAAFESDGSLSPDQDNNPIGQVHEDPPTMYTTGPSIHFDLGSRMGATPLALRVGGDHGEHARDFYLSTDSNGDTIVQRDPGEPNPSVAFDNLFGNAGGEVAEPSPRERLRAKRGSVLDSVLSDFGRAMGEVGSVDRQRLERHADHIRQVERSIQATAQIVCDNPALNLPAGMPDNFNDGDGRFDDLIAAAQFDLISTVLACQASPLVHLHFSNIQTNKFPFLNGGVDMFESGDEAVNWHAAVHHDDGESPESSARRLTAMTWYAQLLADLIDRLQSVPEGEGTLMDSTLIVWVSSLRYSSHATESLPVVLAGDLGGALNGGRFLDYASHGSGGTVGDLWASVGNIMLMDDLSNGWSDAPLSGFGLEGTHKDGRSFQNGPLPGLLASA